MAKKLLILITVVMGMGVVALMGFQQWLNYGISTDYSGKPIYIHLDKQVSVRKFGSILEEKKYINNGRAFDIYSRWWKKRIHVPKGTYEIVAGMSADDIFSMLDKPVLNMVRVPEGMWIQRVANILEEKKAFQKEDYLKKCKDVQAYKKNFSFLGDKIDSLEGYLFPDTYDMPYMMGADEVIKIQLKEFEKKILPLVPSDIDLHKLIVIASLLQLEARDYEDMRNVAGVIYNRLQKGMKLELCSTALYSMNQWRALKPGEAANAISENNTYHHQGLPATPVCSPSVQAVKAALDPVVHDYLFFVYQPLSKKHFYSKTFTEHCNGIRMRKRELKKMNTGRAK